MKEELHFSTDNENFVSINTESLEFKCKYFCFLLKKISSHSDFSTIIIKQHELNFAIYQIFILKRYLIYNEKEW